MQEVLQLQTAHLSVESKVIKVRNARMANRINLHVALELRRRAGSDADKVIRAERHCFRLQHVWDSID
jgi:hypothetical protein